jgi:hypothetical protein
MAEPLTYEYLETLRRGIASGDPLPSYLASDLLHEIHRQRLQLKEVSAELTKTAAELERARKLASP